MLYHKIIDKSSVCTEIKTRSHNHKEKLKNRPDDIT